MSVHKCPAFFLSELTKMENLKKFLLEIETKRMRIALIVQCRIVSAYHLTVDTNGAQIDQSWLFEKDDLTYIDIAKTFEQTYFVTDYAGGSGDSGALNELTIAFGETMDGMPDIRITVSENGYIQINGKRAYPLSLKYAGKRLYVHLLGCLQDGGNQQQ